ncbi:GDSL-type esterase/lipase family protein [Sphingomonas solaris]|nr:GDSL-type esterase/lipase family protein [Sphingomonas solaris]
MTTSRQMPRPAPNMRRGLLLAGLAALIATPAPTLAAAADTTCANAQLPDTPVSTKLREMSLTPGVKIDPATFMKDPETAAYVAQLTSRQQALLKTDWSGLCRYRADNAAQAIRPRAVFLGDSITENWGRADPGFFSDTMLDRGISGQTSSQILLRFYPDVVALKPAVVHIMAGTNDILQNAGAIRDDDVVNNFGAMLDVAQANRIRVVIASIPPISVRSWQPDLKPAVRVKRLNDRLRTLATQRGAVFVDYFAPLHDADDGLRADLGNDGVHPNRAGYAAMRPLASGAVARATR